MQGTMLIVDDLEISREILSLYFEDKFTILEAENGKEALDTIEVCRGFIDIILLDLSMPEMGGREFLEYRKTHDDLTEIPVVVITASSQVQDQLKMFELGIDDYITKPFVPEVVDYRIQKVINNHKSYCEVLKEKTTFKLKAEIDMMTGIYNKETTENLIGDALQNPNRVLNAMFVLDIDKFKKVNDTEGHLVGDSVIKQVANMIASEFRKTDVVGRIGGDEFAVLMQNIPGKQEARIHAQNLVNKINEKENMDIPPYVTLSIGLAFDDKASKTYYELFEKADHALYACKMNGRNQYQEYGIEKEEKKEEMASAYIFNSSRTVQSMIEDALQGKLDLVEKHDLASTFEQNDLCKVVFVDISEEKDQGISMLQQIQKLQKENQVPVVIIYQEGNMEQCRNSFLIQVKELLTTPIHDAMAKRIVSILLES